MKSITTFLIFSRAFTFTHLRQTAAIKQKKWWWLSRGKMKYVYFVSCLLLIANTSCSKYQYALLDSDLGKNKSNQFVHETDTVRIKYSFAGRNGPIKIEIFNKLKNPIYVDWKKSALVKNETRFSYWRDQSIINASTSGYDIHWTNQVSSNGSQTSGTIFRTEQISFIPPQSSISISPFQIESNFFQLPQATKENKIRLNGYDAKAIKFSYQQDNSPFKFRSYLTLATTDDFRNPIILDNQFWISEIMESLVEPPMIPNKSDNQFYMSAPTQFGELVAVFMGSLLIIWLVIASTGD